MDDNEYLRPEGALIEEALAASGRSMRAAAKAIGISDSRLRHIVRGYQPVGREQRIEVVAPANTLAQIALSLGLSPDSLQGAGRGDAAEVMRDRLLAATGDVTAVSAHREWGRILESRPEVRKWLSNPESKVPPRVVLRCFSDDDLLAEIAVRLGARVERNAPEPRRVGGPRKSLSAVTSKTDDAVAAHEEEGSIAGEQEQPTEP